MYTNNKPKEKQSSLLAFPKQGDHNARQGPLKQQQQQQQQQKKKKKKKKKENEQGKTRNKPVRPNKEQKSADQHENRGLKPSVVKKLPGRSGLILSTLQTKAYLRKQL